MRFKAKLVPEQLSLLSQLVVPLARIAGSSTEGWTKNGSVLSIDNNHLRICVKGRSNDTEDIRCFAELVTKDGIFLDYRIESAAENNAIVMEVDLAQFKVALQSLASGGGKSSSADANANHALDSSFMSTIIHIKLAKRNQIPCLCFDAITQGSIHVYYSLPVRILRPSEMQHYQPPPINVTASMLQLQLLRDKPLKPVLEGLRPLSNTVVLEATAQGELTVTVDTDGAMIRAFYSQMPVLETAHAQQQYGNEQVPSSAQQQQQGSNATPAMVRVKLDTKKLVACLQWQWSMVSSARICLLENEMVILHVHLYPRQVGQLSYYIPVQYLSAEGYDG
ncbi:hypothetical protein MPSEU_000235600 [Mayamaea pseudoterrestris]|nr:hypothetical protein MPSEU_000235600 [Mayamaea pseudoterrestris]